MTEVAKHEQVRVEQDSFQGTAWVALVMNTWRQLCVTVCILSRRRPYGETLGQRMTLCGTRLRKLTHFPQHMEFPGVQIVNIKRSVGSVAIRILKIVKLVGCTAPRGFGWRHHLVRQVNSQNTVVHEAKQQLTSYFHYKTLSQIPYLYIYTDSEIEWSSYFKIFVPGEMHIVHTRRIHQMFGIQNNEINLS